MALFINGVGQDTFSMNGVSIDNLYVDGVLVWSSAVNTAPVISIIGDNPMYLVLNGSAYVEQGATATDAEDGDITNDIVIGGDTPDVSVEGYYYVTYNVSDSEGLAAEEKIRTVSVYVVTAPKYELTEALYNDGTFDYVPDSNNPESAFQGKLTESDGTTPYLPTADDYPQDGTLKLDGGRQIDTQFVFDQNFQGGAYGIYDVVPGTSYKIWATAPSMGYIWVDVYEGDQDTPLTLTFDHAETVGLVFDETCIITEGRPSWLPVVADLELWDGLWYEPMNYYFDDATVPPSGETCGPDNYTYDGGSTLYMTSGVDVSSANSVRITKGPISNRQNWMYKDATDGLCKWGGTLASDDEVMDTSNMDEMRFYLGNNTTEPTFSVIKES